MANTAAAKKALRASANKEVINKARKNRIRSFVKKVEDSIKSGNEEKAKTAFKALEPEIMKGVGKKVLKLGSASRKLHRLALKIRKIKAA